MLSDSFSRWVDCVLALSHIFPPGHLFSRWFLSSGPEKRLRARSALSEQYLVMGVDRRLCCFSVGQPPVLYPFHRVFNHPACLCRRFVFVTKASQCPLVSSFLNMLALLKVPRWMWAFFWPPLSHHASAFVTLHDLRLYDLTTSSVASGPRCATI
jgi:hypothetical protein